MKGLGLVYIGRRRVQVDLVGMENYQTISCLCKQQRRFKVEKTLRTERINSSCGVALDFREWLGVRAISCLRAVQALDKYNDVRTVRCVPWA